MSAGAPIPVLGSPRAPATRAITPSSARTTTSRRKDVVGVELRQLKLDTSFDDIGLGKVKAGGSLLWLGYRRYF